MLVLKSLVSQVIELLMSLHYVAEHCHPMELNIANWPVLLAFYLNVCSFHSCWQESIDRDGLVRFQEALMYNANGRHLNSHYSILWVVLRLGKMCSSSVMIKLLCRSVTNDIKSSFRISSHISIRSSNAEFEFRRWIIEYIW